MRNRPIKFRAWLPDIKRMMYLHDPRECSRFNPCLVWWDNENAKLTYFEAGDDPKLDSAILMQYTGLMDRSGKDIYDGDIVTIEQVTKEKYNAPVRFRNGQFCIESDGDYFPLIHAGVENNWEKAKNHFEVIGNIHENNHLLKNGHA